LASEEKGWVYAPLVGMAQERLRGWGSETKKKIKNKKIKK
jgi:hypothetical protein